MKRVLIIGATSAIAEQTARIYASRSAALFLVGRDLARLNNIAEDLRVRGATSVDTYAMDANQFDQHAAMLDVAITTLGNFDIALIAHGSLPDQLACETSVELAFREFTTNSTSVILLANAIAKYLCPHATIAAISSVAGDRGRASNYLYGSAKAAVSAFFSGLRQRLARDNIQVLTIKPGFVDTPMTMAFRKGPLWAKPETVARGIVRAIDRRSDVVYLPWFWFGIMLVIRAMPEFVFKRIKL